MKQLKGKLNANKIKANAYPPGNYSDGNNLYLRVKPTGARSWVFRYKVDGHPKEIGIGSLIDRTLTEARNLVIDMRRSVAAGMNPKSLLAPKQQTKTFSDYASELIESKKAGWRNAKHAQQWVNTIEQYAMPVIGGKQVKDIDLSDIKRIITPIWVDKTETASRLRMRIEAVIDYGYLHEGIDKANPARWKGCLDKLLPARKKTQTVQHFNAIHYNNLPDFMAKLRSHSSMSALCIQWILLTACRSGEARLMTWQEIDFSTRIWTVPAAKMKACREHRIPLSDQCIHVLTQAEKFKSLSKDGLVFFGRSGKALSDVAVSKTLKALSYKEATVHGLRSGFKDWSSDKTDCQRNIIEASLAHSLGAVELAYQRSDLLEKRRQLMSDWAIYLTARPKEHL